MVSQEMVHCSSVGGSTAVTTDVAGVLCPFLLIQLVYNGSLAAYTRGEKKKKKTEKIDTFRDTISQVEVNLIYRKKARSRSSQSVSL